jgi:hypothetical protein
MKGLVSEKTRRFETKFVNPITIQNNSNFIAASNNDNMMFVESTNRRYVCLEVNDKYAGVSTPEISAYMDRLRSVSPGSIAHLGYTRDISKFNSRQFPTSAYQRYQKVINFDTVHLFVEENLQRGYFITEIPNGYDELTQTPDVWVQRGGVMNKESLYNAYCIAASHACNRYNAVETSTAFFNTLKKLICYESCKPGPRGEQERCLRIGTLANCRQKFQAGVHETTWEWINF